MRNRLVRVVVAGLAVLGASSVVGCAEESELPPSIEDEPSFPPTIAEDSVPPVVTQPGTPSTRQFEEADPPGL